MKFEVTNTDKKAINEVRPVASYIFKQILILLHPFIPFITEEIWLKNKLDNSKKNFLMLSNWPSGKSSKDKNLKEVERMISIITQIRSFKNEINMAGLKIVSMKNIWGEIWSCCEPNN